MYRVMIVDDEPIIRYGIRASIDWSRLSMVVSGEYANGAEALSALETEAEAADILITDIKMPVMDGLELTRRALGLKPELKVIFISSYNDFDFVREGLRLGIVDYILKPTLEPDELTALLLRCVDELKRTDQSERRRSYEQWFRRYFSAQGGAHAAQGGGNHVVQEGVHAAAEDAEAVGVQPPWLENRYVAAWIALDDAEEAAPSAFMEQALQLEEIGKQFYLTPEGKEGIACMTDEGEMAWLFPLRGRGNEAAQGGAQGESDVTQGDGEVAAIVKRLHRDVTHKSGVSFSLGYAHASGTDRIMDCLELGRAACRRRFAEGKGKVFAPLPEEARAWSGSALQMRRALDYIHERCYDGVTLREVASHVHLSRNYFCHLFKKHTGHNFMDYVIRLRIEQAKRLLKETDAKVYEVAERSGFNDVKYFGKLFKKMTGLSPIEYRDRAWAMPGSPGAEAGHQVREDGA